MLPESLSSLATFLHLYCPHPSYGLRPCHLSTRLLQLSDNVPLTPFLCSCPSPIPFLVATLMIPGMYIWSYLLCLNHSGCFLGKVRSLPGYQTLNVPLTFPAHCSLLFPCTLAMVSSQPVHRNTWWYSFAFYSSENSYRI